LTGLCAQNGTFFKSKTEINVSVCSIKVSLTHVSNYKKIVMDEEGNESAVYAYAAFVVPLYVDLCTYNGLTQKLEIKCLNIALYKKRFGVSSLPEQAKTAV
jgi:hypothetical protein